MKTIVREFKSFLTKYIDAAGISVYGTRIRTLGEVNSESLEVSYDHLSAPCTWTACANSNTPCETPGPDSPTKRSRRVWHYRSTSSQSVLQYARRIHFSPKGSNDAAPVARPRRVCFAFETQPITEPPNTNSESFSVPQIVFGITK